MMQFHGIRCIQYYMHDFAVKPEQFAIDCLKCLVCYALRAINCYTCSYWKSTRVKGVARHVTMNELELSVPVIFKFRPSSPTWSAVAVLFLFSLCTIPSTV